MEDKNKNIEVFFNQKFSGNIPEEPWNVPENEIWDNVEKRLDETSKKRRWAPILPWIITGISTLFSLFILMHHLDNNHRISALEKQIEHCNSNKEGQPHKTSLEIKSQSQVIPVDNTIQSQPNSSKVHSRLLNNNIKSTSSLNFSTPQNSLNQTFIEPNLQIKKEDFLTRDIIPLSPVPNEVIEAKQLRNEKANIQLLPIVAQGIPLQKRVFYLSSPPGLNHIDLQHKKDIRPRIFIGPSLAFFHFIDAQKGKVEGNLSELLTNESNSATFGYGIQTKIPLSQKITLDVGAQYLQASRRSNYVLNLNYSTSQEIAYNTNEFGNAFQHSLPSGMGQIETNLLITRMAGSPVSDNEVVNLDFSFLNQTSSVILPLTFSYYVNSVQRGLFFSAGIQNELVLGNEIKNVSVISNHTYVKEKTAAVQFQKNQINTFQARAILGVGYQMKLFGSLDVVGNANYGLALTDIYNKGNFANRLNQANIQLSVLKQF